MSGSRRKWNIGERVEVAGRFGTVVGEHLDGPLVRFDGEGPHSTPRRIHWRDAWLFTDSTCELYRALDAKFGTDSRSPLHHDNRCEACR